MRVAISGCRDGSVSRGRLDQLLAGIPWEHILVGDCPTGIDRNVAGWCRFRKIPYTVFPADWDTHGKAAGPIRNRAMVQEADLLIAFWDGKSKGTLSAIREAVLTGTCPVRVYPL